MTLYRLAHAALLIYLITTEGGASANYNLLYDSVQSGADIRTNPSSGGVVVGLLSGPAGVLAFDQLGTMTNAATFDQSVIEIRRVVVDGQGLTYVAGSIQGGGAWVGALTTGYDQFRWQESVSIYDANDAAAARVSV